VRYDYFGRSYSDRPKLAYDLATYDGQLTELLDSLGLRGLVDVAGVSMGGVIATNFADKHADRVRSLTLVDPYFGRAAGTPFPLRLSGVGEFILTLAAHRRRGASAAD
jgi:pimeloyl-ACP methyl ester carboxylesterase